MVNLENNLETLSFLDEEQVRDISKEFGTPVYIYSRAVLEAQADKVLAFPNAFGLTVRYAMKANSNANILRIFNNKGIHIDASSGHEVSRALAAGIPSGNVLLTSQEFPTFTPGLVGDNILFNACSLNQLESYGKIMPSVRGVKSIGVRINPGLGSGGTNRTNTGGPGSSFGIWHEQFDDVLKIAKKYGLKINRVHTHIGSGSDPDVWKKVSGMSLDIVERFLDAGHKIDTLNLGGGYKVGRMKDEESTDLQECGMSVKERFEDFYEKTGRRLRLEIEPGTFLVANAGAVIAEAKDIKSTPGYNFIITNSGMNEVTRPSLYGAQHPIVVVSRNEGSERGIDEYVVSGNCCESGDILTPGKDDPEALGPKYLREAKVGDLVVVEGAGAYCSSMSIKNYNSYPTAAEVLIGKDNVARLIRERGNLADIIRGEKLVF